MTNTYESVADLEDKNHNRLAKNAPMPTGYTADTIDVYSFNENQIYPDQNYNSIRRQNNYQHHNRHQFRPSPQPAPASTIQRAEMKEPIDYDQIQVYEDRSKYVLKLEPKSLDHVSHISDNPYKLSTIYNIRYLTADVPSKSCARCDHHSAGGEVNNTNNTLSSQQTSRSRSSKHAIYAASSHAELLQSGQSTPTNAKSNPNRTRKSRKTTSACCLIRSCCSVFYVLLKVFKCFRCLCCQPLCSTAAVLSVFSLMAGVLAGGLCLGIFGIIPIPVEVTRAICNASSSHNFTDRHYYHNNLTIIKEIQHFIGSGVNDTNSKGGDRSAKTNQAKVDQAVRRMQQPANGTAGQFSPEQERLFEAFKKNATSRLRNLKKYRNRISKFIPIDYNIVLRPNFDPNILSKIDSNGVEMAMTLDVCLFCNSSTSLISLATREFSNIDLREKTSGENVIKKWKHNSETNILEVEMKQPCEQGKLYMLTMAINYKNYAAAGGYESAKTRQKKSGLYIASFKSKFDYPFPVVVDVMTNRNFFGISASTPSVFNITMLNNNSLMKMINNLNVQKREELNALEYVYYKPSPIMQPFLISFIFGEFKCRESPDLFQYSIKLKICSLSTFDLNAEVYNVLSDQLKSLFEYLMMYTKQNYHLDKLDVIILPKKSADELIENEDVKTVNVGLIYIGDTYLDEYQTNDYISRTKFKFKLTHSIAKQLTKHWFQQSNDFHCDSMHIYANEQEQLFADNLRTIKNYCPQLRNCSYNDQPLATIDDSNATNNSATARFVINDLHLFEKCYFYKSIVNWISYLAFQSIYPQLFDLVNLEWSLVKDVEKNYYLDNNRNADFVYENYEFPKLSENWNFQDILIEIKNLVLTRAIYYMVGQEKFQYLIRDWFKLIETSSHFSVQDAYVNETLALQAFYNYNQLIKRNSSILNILQQYISQYDVVPFQEVTINDILMNWMFADNDVLVKIDRNYNGKEAVVRIENSNNTTGMIDFYYPLNWLHGSVKFDLKKVTAENFNQETQTVWLKSQTTRITSFPGADQWVIGNYLNMFSLLRVNYDKQNWLFLTDKFLFNYESLDPTERATIIDDAFYLIHNDMLPISYGLNILDYLSQENKYLPWKYALKHVRTIFDYIEDHSQIYYKFREYIINLVKPTYKRLQWGENYLDTYDEKLIRILVVDLLCFLDYDDCVENSVKQLTDVMKINVNNVPEYLNSIVYCTAIRHTSSKEWYYLWNVYSTAVESQPIRRSSFYSLGCSSQVWLLNLYFNRLVYETTISNGELQVLIDFISKNSAGKYVVWNHISQNYQTFFNKIGNDLDLLIKLIQIATQRFKFKYEIKQIYNFIDDIGLSHVNVDPKRDEFANRKEQLFTSIESRVEKFAKWQSTNGNDLDNWLNKKLNLQ